jgi:hypothetical protein
LNAANDKFGATPNGQDHLAEATEKVKPLFFIVYCNQLIEAGSGTECPASGRFENDYGTIRGCSCMVNAICYFG